MEEVIAKLLKKGDKFCSLEKLEEQLAVHMEQSCTIFWKRDVRTLRIAAKTIPRAATCNQDLHYYFVKYACNHGGKKFVSKKSVHSTRKSSSFKNGCGAFLLFMLSEDGQSLFLKSESSVHNHPIASRHIFKQFLRKRKSRHEAKEESSPNTQKQAIKKRITKISKPQVNLNAVSVDNSPQPIPMETLETENVFENCMELLNIENGCNVDTLSNPENKLKATFFQDRVMKETFDAYPEMLFVDCTFRLVKICVTVCLFTVVNPAGVCDIVAAALLYSDDDDSFEWVANTFKKQNRRWSVTSIIMTDKDASRRAVLARHFPTATSLICRYHVAQSFRQDVNTRKLGVTQAEEIVSKGYLQKLMDSPNEQAYDSVYCEMVDTLPQKVGDYFNRNWHVIRTQWVYGYSHRVCVFFDDFFRRVETLCKKFHSLTRRFTTLKQFLIGLFAQVSIQRVECDNQAFSLMQTKFNNYSQMSSMAKFSENLTDFAFSLVDTQFKQIENLEKGPLETSDGSNFLFKTTSGEFVANHVTCECSFFMWLSLPCQHIFFVRKHTQDELFDIKLCTKRWTRSYYLSEKPLERVVEADSEDENLQTSKNYEEILDLTSSIAIIGSRARGQEFQERMQVLNNLIYFWMKGKKVQVLELIEPEFVVEVEVNDRETVRHDC